MDQKGKKAFSLRKRIGSANHALRGVGILFKGTHNAQAYLFFVAVLAYLGITLRISSMEWIALILTTSLVLAAEAVNTAIEIYLDHKDPEHHPAIRDVKDVAAGAVIIAVFLGGIIGMIIFIPKVIALYC